MSLSTGTRSGEASSAERDDDALVAQLKAEALRDNRAPRERLQRARHAVRELERFCYRELYLAVDPVVIDETRSLLRLVVGLRRKLDARRARTKE